MKTNSSRKGPSMVNAAGGIAAPSQVFWCFLNRFVCLCADAFSCNTITLPCLLAHSGRFSINAWFKLIISCSYGLELTVSIDFRSSWNTTPFWSHQTQNIAFLPNRSIFAVDVDGCTGLTDDFLHLGFLKWIHFSSLVTLRCKTDFFSYL